MNKDTINAEKGSVVVTGNVKGNITTNTHAKAEIHKNIPESSPKPAIKIPITDALIAAAGSKISGLLIAASNWFSG